MRHSIRSLALPDLDSDLVGLRRSDMTNQGDGYFRFYLDGTEFGNMSWHVDRADSSFGHYGFVRPQFRDDYARWAKAGARMSWHAEENF